ncbi:hypothetical protein RHMOL_Rhmol09G0122200 [Rhododendron molle]|uniref:Uncharacterized protein n=1 Tax=Rhododendron molle TaxID=49168 RepID=A0ACC0MDU4_RHOML|nr:hypothetical protein RHMOL_Rhmol09G0122200 [Rhododendron molle]
MDDNVQRNGKNVVIDICDDSSNDDGNDEKRLDELTEEEVYQMTFDMHEDGGTFYNAYAKVNGFSIRNYNMHKDNAGIVKSRNVTLERSSGKYLVNNFVSVHNHPLIGPCGVPFLRSHRKVLGLKIEGRTRCAFLEICRIESPLFLRNFSHQLPDLNIF